MNGKRNGIQSQSAAAAAATRPNTVINGIWGAVAPTIGWLVLRGLLLVASTVAFSCKGVAEKIRKQTPSIRFRCSF